MKEEKKEKKEKRKKINWGLWVLPAALVLLLYVLFSFTKERADLAVTYFSRPVRDALGTLTAAVPFSVMEVLIILAAVGLIAFIVRTVVLAFKGELGLVRLFRRLGGLLLAAVYVLSLFLALWGIDYRSSSFSDKEGFSAAGVKNEDLYATAEFFINKAMELADTVKRDENGLFSEDMDEYLAACTTVYDVLEGRFPSLKAQSRTPKKMLFSEVMSITGFTGVFFPFTGESNLNINTPAAFVPAIAAHELAHQRGVYSEQEANFLGVTASALCDIPAYRYSGYVMGALYLMNAVYDASPDKWQELRDTFTGDFLKDWQYNSDYWRKYETPVSQTTEQVYDGYLKANGQPSGIQSYGECVDLLVAYYLAGGYGA